MPEKRPDIAVVVPSRNRPLRLRWLLNALEDQTLSHDRFEVIVAHDSSGPATEELLRTHPLAKTGALRHITYPPNSNLPGAKRNAGWRAASAPLIAFTDDDCRPPADWLECALQAAERHPGAIIQGATRPDPDEDAIGRQAPWVLTQSIWPPRPWAETCNILYPREVLEENDGFREDLFPGEDTDLAERARATGVEYVGATDLVTWHAVEESSLLGMVRGTWRWKDTPELIRLHPRLRHEFPLGMFRRYTHTWLLPAVAGVTLSKRSRLTLLLTVPYLVHATPKHYGPHPRGRLRAVSEVPGRFAIDAAEMVGLVWGSIRHRTLFL